MTEFLIAMTIVLFFTLMHLFIANIIIRNKYPYPYEDLQRETERLSFEYKKRKDQFIRDNNITLSEYHKMFEGKCE